MVIVIVSDRAGYHLKVECAEFLKELGHEVIDVGSNSEDHDMVFPDVAKALCPYILEKRAQRGIVFCGTGVGIAVACNKIPGIRASVVHDIQTAHQCVEHDDVQVMCIGEKIVGSWLAKDLIPAFLAAKLDPNPRFRQMVDLLEEMDGSLKKQANSEEK